MTGGKRLGCQGRRRCDQWNDCRRGIPAGVYASVLVVFPDGSGLRGWRWRVDQLGDKFCEGHDVFVLARLFQGVHVLITARDRDDGPRGSPLTNTIIMHLSHTSFATLNRTSFVCLSHTNFMRSRREPFRNARRTRCYFWPPMRDRSIRIPARPASCSASGCSSLAFASASSSSSAGIFSLLCCGISPGVPGSSA